MLEGLRCCDILEPITHTILVWKVGYSGADLVATHNSKAGEWWWLCMMNSNLNHAKPFNIHMVREWKVWDAVNCPNQSKLTQSWCEKWARAKPTLTPPAPQKHVVVTIIEPIYQPQPSPTIHHTYNEKLEMRRCYEILQSIQTCSILVWNVGYCEPQIGTTHNLKCKVWWWLWMMNSNLNLAQPYIIPTMRHWKGWDAMNCSNQSKLKQSWCEKQTRAKPTLTPPVSEKHVVVSILEPIYQSPPSPTIHYTYNEKLEGWWCYDFLNQSKHTPSWCET